MKKDDREANQGASTRAGGDVVTKGPSRPSEDEGGSGQRAGGDVVTKGATQENEASKSSE